MGEESAVQAETTILSVSFQEPSLGSAFQLFQSQQYGESDLLFKDATRYLVPVSHLDYEAILGASFFQFVQSVFNCTHAGKLGCSERNTAGQTYVQQAVNKS